MEASKWREHSGLPIEITNSIGMKLVLIPPGEFTMGSPRELIREELLTPGIEDWYKDRLPGEGPRHLVRITRPFYFGEYLVTQEEYQRVMGINPSEFSATGNGKGKVAGEDTRRCPAENVSWDDAQEFCRKLSNLPEEQSAGRTYQLPYEAQWEYACRAGSIGRFSFDASGSAVPKESENNRLLDYGWFDGNSGGKTHPVGEKKPNAVGAFRHARQRMGVVPRLVWKGLLREVADGRSDRSPCRHVPRVSRRRLSRSGVALRVGVARQPRAAARAVAASACASPKLFTNRMSKAASAEGEVKETGKSQIERPTFAETALGVHRPITYFEAR